VFMARVLPLWNVADPIGESSSAAASDSVPPLFTMTPLMSPDGWLTLN